MAEQDSEGNLVATDARTTTNINDVITSVNRLHLNSVLEDFTVKDYRSCLFLLMDFVGEDEFLSISKQNKNFLKEKLDTVLRKIGGVDIFIDLFTTLKLHKKLKNYGTCQHIFEKIQQKFYNISDIWKLFYALCEEINDADLEVLKYMLPDNVHKEIQSPEEWFCYALKRKIISKSDIAPLEKIFHYHTTCSDIIRNFDKPNCYNIRTATANTNCGIALILNYHKFIGGYERKGSNIDVNSLKEVWDSFGFKSVIYADLTYRETLNVLKEYASLDHSDYDAFVCCILSHGLSNSVMSTDGLEMPLPHLIAQITNNCPSLGSKPKLFFVEACQGYSIQEGPGKPIYQIRHPNMFVPSYTPPEPPIASDLLLAASSIDGYVSFRSHISGSFFIEALCQVMKQKGDKLSILDVMIKVNDLVRGKVVDFGPGRPRMAHQIVNCSNSFRKMLILKKRTV